MQVSREEGRKEKMDENEKLYADAGRRIRRLREKLGLSREKLASFAKISTKHLYEIEVKGKGFSAKVLYDLAKGLNSSLDYILKGEDYCKSGDIQREERQKVIEILDSMYDILLK